MCIGFGLSRSWGRQAYISLVHLSVAEQRRKTTHAHTSKADLRLRYSSTMFTSLYIVAVVSSLAIVVQAFLPSERSVYPNLHKRLTGQSIAFACFGGGGDCQCPLDLNNDEGVLINVYPGYQCAYPNGACQWDDKTGALQNTGQTNCPTSAPCSTVSGCQCPLDLNGDTGVLINQFTGYQCAYPNGACTWDGLGNLQNIAQTNCPGLAKCAQLGNDS